MSTQPYALVHLDGPRERRPTVADRPGDIPLRTYLVSARHVSPYFGGHLEVRFAEDGIQCRFYGSGLWADMIPWHELAFKAGVRPEQYIDELKFSRQDAELQGYQDGYAAGLEAARKKDGDADPA